MILFTLTLLFISSLIYLVTERFIALSLSSFPDLVLFSRKNRKFSSTTIFSDKIITRRNIGQVPGCCRGHMSEEILRSNQVIIRFIIPAPVVTHNNALKVGFIEYGIFGEGSQISTNQKRETTVVCISITCSRWLLD